MASLPPEALAAALSAVHGAGAKGGAPPTAGTDSAGGGASDPSQDPNAQAGDNQNAQQQAVWSAFPSTDPSNIPQGGGDPQAFAGWLGQFMQQAQSDHDQLSQQQEAVLQQAMDQNGGGAPSTPGQDMSGGAPQAPGVGGQGAGY